MKRIFCLLLTLSLSLLCACGKTDTPPSDGMSPRFAACTTITPTGRPSPPPTASCPWRPMPAGVRQDYLPLWHEGEYTQLAANGGEGLYMTDLTGGKATEAGGLWPLLLGRPAVPLRPRTGQGQLYPRLLQHSGGVLWLELEETAGRTTAPAVRSGCWRLRHRGHHRHRL